MRRMKRVGPISNEEPDKKKSTVSAAVVVAGTGNAGGDASIFKLTDFPDEILVKVYSFLYFKYRQITRSLSRRLFEFVDESTAGAEKLSIELTAGRRIRDNMPFAVFMRPDGKDPDSTVLVTVVVLAAGVVDAGTKFGLSVANLLSGFPPLRSIRPKTVSLHYGAGFNFPKGLSLGLMQHLVQQQVPRSATAMVLSLAPQLPILEVEQVLPLFEHSSHIGVQTLRVEQGNSTSIPSVACLTRLVSLSVTIHTEAAMQSLVPLSSHPTLRELVIRGTKLNFLFMNSLAAWRNIRKLNLYINCRLSSTDAERLNAFTSMMRGTEHLEYLGGLRDPSVEFWQHLTENNIVSNSLRELGIGFSYRGFSDKECKAMIEGLQRFVPCLTTLHLRTEEREEHKIHLLSKLQQHPHLTSLKLERSWPLEQDVLSSLKRDLGKRIQVVPVVP